LTVVGDILTETLLDIEDK